MAGQCIERTRARAPVKHGETQRNTLRRWRHRGATAAGQDADHGQTPASQPTRKPAAGAVALGGGNGPGADRGPVSSGGGCRRVARCTLDTLEPDAATCGLSPGWRLTRQGPGWPCPALWQRLRVARPGRQRPAGQHRQRCQQRAGQSARPGALRPQRHPRPFVPAALWRRRGRPRPRAALRPAPWPFFHRTLRTTNHESMS